MKCTWCKSTGFLRLDKRKIVCLNCRGSGKGGDGGVYRTIGGRSKRLLRNQYGVKKFQILNLFLRGAVDD